VAIRDLAGEAGRANMAQSTTTGRDKEYNQVAELQDMVAKLRENIHNQELELLQLYRKLFERGYSY
jgi:hypothetical protein